MSESLTDQLANWDLVACVPGCRRPWRRIARAQRNDHLLNREESAAQLAVIEQVIRSRPDRSGL